MNKVAEFQLVSDKQFLKDIVSVSGASASIAKYAYSVLRIPKRATIGSAGHDFISPISFELKPGEDIAIATGIRAKIDDGWVLQIYPRSGLGFKYQVALANTVGIIDSDYYYSSNEGHIIIKIVNRSKDKTLAVKAGDAFAQGLFIPFGITYTDNVHEKRDGGFGSTTKL